MRGSSAKYDRRYTWKIELFSGFGGQKILDSEYHGLVPKADLAQLRHEVLYDLYAPRGSVLRVSLRNEVERIRDAEALSDRWFRVVFDLDEDRRVKSRRLVSVRPMSVFLGYDGLVRAR